MKIILTLTLLMMFLSALTNLYAADQVVTNNNDDGAGSLRQAIADDPYFTENPEFTVITESEVKGGLLRELKNIEGIKKITIY